MAIRRELSFKYANGRKPGPDTQARPRNLFVIVRILLQHETAATVRNWILGTNHDLDHNAPIELLPAVTPRRFLRPPKGSSTRIPPATGL